MYEFEQEAKGLTQVLIDQQKAEESWAKQMQETTPSMGKLTDFIDEAKEAIKEYKFESKKNTTGDSNDKNC